MSKIRKVFGRDVALQKIYVFMLHDRGGEPMGTLATNSLLNLLLENSR